MVVTVYWPLLHSHAMREVARLQLSNDTILYWVLVFNHLWPFLTIVVNVMITRVTFEYSHFTYVL